MSAAASQEGQTARTCRAPWTGGAWRPGAPFRPNRRCRGIPQRGSGHRSRHAHGDADGSSVEPTPQRCLRRDGGGGAKGCLPKMARQGFPDGKFRFSHDGPFGSGEGGGGADLRRWLSAVLLHPWPTPHDWHPRHTPPLHHRHATTPTPQTPHRVRGRLRVGGGLQRLPAVAQHPRWDRQRTTTQQEKAVRQAVTQRTGARARALTQFAKKHRHDGDWASISSSGTAGGRGMHGRGKGRST